MEYCFFICIILTGRLRFYTFLSLKELTIKNDKMMIRKKKVGGGRKGIAKKLNVAKQPAAVIGSPV